MKKLEFGGFEKGRSRLPMPMVGSLEDQPETIAAAIVKWADRHQLR
jgi:hypothetical protein